MKKIKQLGLTRQSTRKLNLMVLMGLYVWQSASAATVIGASMSGKAYVDPEHGGQICGIRIASTGENGTGDERKLVSAAILVSKTSTSVKLSGFELPPGKTGIKQLVPHTIYGGWLKAEGKEKASSIPPLYNKQVEPNSKVFHVDVAAGKAVLDAISKNNVIQIAVSWQPNIETIYSGQVQINEDQINQFKLCLDKLTTTDSPSQYVPLPTSKKTDEILQTVISANGGFIDEKLHQDFWTELARNNQKQVEQDIKWAHANILLMQQYQRELWESALISYRSEKVAKTETLSILEKEVPIALKESLPYPLGSLDYKKSEAIIDSRLLIAMDNSRKLLLASSKHTDFQGILVNEEYLLKIINNIDGSILRVKRLLNKKWTE